ncbi:kinase-like domain-containing protein [Aspergillus pseudonomiae]|uniref:Kinase-like domain-containing protein n=1 Tax=Aspergillus pseudonomiae TaxID=1506151 RepID=A0A5N7CRG2_9EURO|nr:kinase-like domain-containing protein [Aspergillus pseudonomiae]KAE8396791.1 kinase-like domain-containing protein [Aspergillus pseudonomiae]
MIEMALDVKPDIFTYADFDLEALCRRASALREGVSCVCDPDQRPCSGSFNWAIFISFEDGMRWVFRSPHTREFMPMELGMKLLASEAATLRYLRAHSDVPVPEVYDYCTSSDNDIGIPFIFMSEASGWPLSRVWRPAGSPQPDLDTSRKAKVLTQLGAITWKLSQLRLDQIGSLVEKDGAFEIQECLSRGHVLRGRYDLDIPRGPFTSAAEFYDSLVSAFSEHAEILQLSHHCFVAPVPSLEDYQSKMQYRSAVNLWSDFVTIGGKTDSSENRVDYIIAGDALRDTVPTLQLPAVDRKTFPLCHADLSVNNIYVDDQYNITCIIDWAFASSIPESMLLGAPGLPQYCDEISSELLAPFRDGFIAAMPGSIEKELGARYRESLERSQVSWRLSRLLSLDSIEDYDLFATVWHSARGPGEDMGEYFLHQRRSARYAQVYSEVKKEDQPLSKIEKDENDYFQNKDFRKTIAKKLTLISEWKTQYTVNSPPILLRSNMFVASPNLWKWIEQFAQEWTAMFNMPATELIS